MTTLEEGKEYVDVRNKWPREDLDFTPWLAENLAELTAPLGVELELVKREKPVGPFYCDILAKVARSDVMVAIENQLEWTDHTHLTQLLTYAAGLDARIAVWIAPEFRYEHAEALNWLNNWTRDELQFYGVKVTLQSTANGPPEPRFLPVVTPQCWNKNITQPPGASVSPRSQQYGSFFKPLIEKLIWTDFADRAVNNFGPASRLFRCTCFQGIGYGVSLETDNYAWVTLQIRMADKEHTKTVYDFLEEHKESIEGCIPDQDWHWRRNTAFAFSSINVRTRGSIDDPPGKLEETRTWMLDLLPRFKEVFEPHLARILTGAQT